jgi:hypothetical protein
VKTRTFTFRSRVEAPAEEVFRWHTRPGAFERLAPPWQRIEVLERTGGVENGARAVMRMHFGPLRTKWVAEHLDYIEGRQFRDVQIEGPFAYWQHTHRIEPVGASACQLEDHIEYAFPLGPIGTAFGGAFTHNSLARLFAYRHRTTGLDVITHSAYKGPVLRVLVSGSTGLIGSALVPFLTTGGHEVARLVRSRASAGEDAIFWKPSEGTITDSRLEGFDAAVHLAGENISSGRWTAEKKTKIRDSRVRSTKLLSESLSKLSQPPKVLVCASAIGYYGSRGDEVLTEESAPGEGFLTQVCREWEAAAEPARKRGIRVVHLRFGVVLSAAGGALAAMLTPFRLGLGGVVGPGSQYMSWISRDDAVSTVFHALTNDALSGPVNAVAPEPVTNREYTKTLGRVLGRPTLFAIPAFAARLAFGEMADELLLSSTRVVPKRLQESGYRFREPNLEAALRHTLGRD